MLESQNSLSVTRILEKPAIRAFQVLIGHYGVYADIYKPLDNKQKNILHGFYDNDVKYDEVPYLQTKVLIPSLYRRRQSTNLSVLDPFIDSETYMYLPNNILLLRFSLVVCRLQDKRLLNYKVLGNNPVNNDAGVIIRRYELAPVMTTDFRKNINEIKANLEKELEQFEKNETIDSSITDYNKNSSNEFSYLEIE